MSWVSVVFSTSGRLESEIETALSAKYTRVIFFPRNWASKLILKFKKIEFGSLSSISLKINYKFSFFRKIEKYFVSELLE